MMSFNPLEGLREISTTKVESFFPDLHRAFQSLRGVKRNFDFFRFFLDFFISPLFQSLRGVKRNFDAANLALSLEGSLFQSLRGVKRNFDLL